MLRFDLDIERMRLGDFATASEVVAFRLEGEIVDFAVQSLELHGGPHTRGRQRLAALVGVQPVLRRHIGLEDGHFQREVAIAQHAAAMRAALVFCSGGFTMAFARFRCGGATAGSEQQSE